MEPSQEGYKKSCETPLGNWGTYFTASLPRRITERFNATVPAYNVLAANKENALVIVISSCECAVF